MYTETSEVDNVVTDCRISKDELAGAAKASAARRAQSKKVGRMTITTGKLGAGGMDIGVKRAQRRFLYTGGFALATSS